MQQELNWGSGADRGTNHQPPLEGGVIFASAEEQAQRSIELLGQGAVVITMPPPTAEARGHLGELLEELVERELARQGAPSPYLSAWSAMPEDAQARLSDQLFRARSLGATGLVISVGSLRAIARPILGTDDSATLRWLASESMSAPLVLLLDDSDESIAAYSAPVPLSCLLDAVSTPSSIPPPRIVAPESDIAVVLIGEPESDEPHLHDVSVELHAAEPEHDCFAEPEPEVDAETVMELERIVAEVTPEVSSDEHAPAVHAHDSEVHADAPAVPAHEHEHEHTPEPVTAPVRMRHKATSEEWRTWTMALGTARGAQPLAAFERLFTESYVPLANALADGLEDSRAIKAHDDFRRSFERSYADAFATFGATNRRPRLVMDAFDIASKQARLANARATHVLVVDSMRWDLGGLVRDVITREAAGAVSLTAETLLWSALPTTSIRQLETFARGLDALRAPATEVEPSESLRGRAAEVVRRMRAGSRELYKLDIVPAMLEASHPEEGISRVLGAIAESTAESILRHMALLPPRTLLFVCGDHGFSIDRRGEFVAGGASPEEVLMPAQAWLVGALH